MMDMIFFMGLVALGIVAVAFGCYRMGYVDGALAETERWLAELDDA